MVFPLRTRLGLLVSVAVIVGAAAGCGSEEAPPPKPVEVKKPPPPPPAVVAIAEGDTPILARLWVDDRTGKLSWIQPGDAKREALVHSGVPPEIEAPSLVALPTKGCEQCANQRGAMAPAAKAAGLNYLEDKDGVLPIVARRALKQADVATDRPPLGVLVDRCGNLQGVVAGGFDADAAKAISARAGALDPKKPCLAAPPPPLPAKVIDPGRRLMERTPGRKLAWALARGKHEVVDGRVSLFGQQPYKAARQGEDLRFGDAPVLVALAATWCVPCGEELGELLELATKVHDDHGVHVVIVSLDPGSRGPAGLRNSVDKLFRMYGDSHAFSKALSPPAWLELRGDPEGAWLGLADTYLADAETAKAAGFEALREGGIPMALLFDACGHLHLAAQEKLDPDALAKIEARAAALAKADKCGTIRSPK